MDKDAKFTACKNITYVIPDEMAADYLAAAFRKVRDDYCEEQAEEALARRQMSEAGVPEEDLPCDYQKPFEDVCGQFEGEVAAWQNIMYRNEMGLPDSLTVLSPEDPEDVIRLAEKAAGGRIKEIGRICEASKRDIVKWQQFQGMNKMLRDKSFAPILNLRANMAGYSPSNLMLIYAQKPDADVVKGKSAWFKEYSRSLKPGEYERPILLFAPNMITLKDEADVDKYLARNGYLYSDKKGYDKMKARYMKKIESDGKATALKGFQTCYVYDISQTKPNSNLDHDNYEEIVHPDRPLGGMSGMRAAVKALEKTAPRFGVQAPGFCMQDGSDFYLAVKQCAESVLAGSPDMLPGITSPYPKKGAAHDMEVIIGASCACQSAGLDCLDSASKGLAQAIGRVPKEDIRLRGLSGIFAECFERGSAFASEFEKTFMKAYRQKDKENGYDEISI